MNLENETVDEQQKSNEEENVTTNDQQEHKVKQQQPLNRDELRAAFATLVQVTVVDTATTTSSVLEPKSEQTTIVDSSNAVDDEHNTDFNDDFIDAGTETINDSLITNTTTGQQQQHQRIERPDVHNIPRFVSKSYIIDSVPTHLWIQYFSDKIIVGISQLDGGRIGNWILCENEFLSSQENHTFGIEQNMLSSSRRHQQQQQEVIRYQTSHLLGSSRNDPILPVYARRIWEKLGGSNTNPTRPVVLGISLKPFSSTHGPTRAHSIDTFHTIINLITNLHQQHGGN